MKRKLQDLCDLVVTKRVKKNCRYRDDAIKASTDGIARYRVDGAWIRTHIHSGYVDRPFLSPSELIKKLFPHDPKVILKAMKASKTWKEGHELWGLTDEQILERWETNGKISRERGKSIHAYFEIAFAGSVDTHHPNYKHFESFLLEMQKSRPDWAQCTVYKQEWMIYDEFNYLCGTVDCVLQRPDGKHIVIDWKFCKEINKFNQFEKGLDFCDHLDSCNYVHYMIQVNLYRKILTSRYNLEIPSVYVVNVNPNDNKCAIYEMPNWDLTDKAFEYAKTNALASSS